MLTIGITGGIGSGKSTVVRILQEYGAGIIFADELAKEIIEPGEPAYYQIIAHFGKDILDVNQKIDRKKLGSIVFSNKDELQVLNQITHGIVAEKIGALLDDFRRQQRSLAVVEAIVPVQHGFLDMVDTVWVVHADEKVRVKRIVKRNNTTEQAAKQRIQAQMSDEAYKSLAHQVIYNNGTLTDLKEQIRGLLIYENNSPSQ